MSDDNTTYTGVLLSRLNPRLWHRDTSNMIPGAMRRSQSQLGLAANKTPLRSKIKQLDEIVDSVMRTGTVGVQFKGPFYAQVLAHYGNGYISLADESTWGPAKNKLAPFIDWIRDVAGEAELCSNALVPAFYARIPELDPIYPNPRIGNPTKDPDVLSTSHFGDTADFFVDKYPLYIGLPWDQDSLNVPPPGSVVIVDYLEGRPGSPIRRYVKTAITGYIADYYQAEIDGSEATASGAFIGNASRGTSTVADTQQKSNEKASSGCGRPTVSAGGESCYYDEEIVEDQPGWKDGIAPGSAAEAATNMLKEAALKERGWIYDDDTRMWTPSE